MLQRRLLVIWSINMNRNINNVGKLVLGIEFCTKDDEWLLPFSLPTHFLVCDDIVICYNEKEKSELILEMESKYKKIHVIVNPTNNFLTLCKWALTFCHTFSIKRYGYMFKTAPDLFLLPSIKNFISQCKHFGRFKAVRGCFYPINFISDPFSLDKLCPIHGIETYFFTFNRNIIIQMSGNCVVFPKPMSNETMLINERPDIIHMNLKTPESYLFRKYWNEYYGNGSKGSIRKFVLSRIKRDFGTKDIKVAIKKNLSIIKKMKYKEGQYIKNRLRRSNIKGMTMPKLSPQIKKFRQYFKNER